MFLAPRSKQCHECRSNRPGRIRSRRCPMLTGLSQHTSANQSNERWAGLPSFHGDEPDHNAREKAVPRVCGTAFFGFIRVSRTEVSRLGKVRSLCSSSNKRGRPDRPHHRYSPPEGETDAMATTNGARRNPLEHGHFRVGSTSVRKNRMSPLLIVGTECC